jgi:hypothetical protein
MRGRRFLLQPTIAFVEERPLRPVQYLGLWLENTALSGDNPTMTVTADDKKRVVLPSAKPGDRFEVQTLATGFVLQRLEPAVAKAAKVTIEKRDGFSVGVLDRPIDENALREALDEFP